MVTYSIVAAVPSTGEIGVAVQSRFLAVGALVSWADASAGAIATQAHADVTVGPRGLALLGRGIAPRDCVELLLASDPMRSRRQFGIVARDGQAASFTGDDCFNHASSIVGDGFAAQGNILVGPQVVDGLVTGFLENPDGPLVERLLDALATAQSAGGERRGQQSASVLVVKQGAGYGGNHDRMVDLRVDDHPTPIVELERLVHLHRLYAGPPDRAGAIPIDPALRVELEGIAGRRGIVGDFNHAIFDLFGWENLEERWIDANWIDPAALSYLRRLDGSGGPPIDLSPE